MRVASGEVPGLEGLTPSYLSIDTDSRVVRLDSWSKVLAPGLRLGWVSAHPEIVDLMALALHASPERAPGGLPGLATTLDVLALPTCHQCAIAACLMCFGFWQLDL